MGSPHRQPGYHCAVLFQSGVICACRSHADSDGILADRGEFYRTIPQLNAPFNNPIEEPLHEIEVSDPAHPLFGRRFTLISQAKPRHGSGHAMVVYREYMRLRIPLSAISVQPHQLDSKTKLTLDSVTELVTLIKQWEVLCPSSLKNSGDGSTSKFKTPSSMTSHRSSRR